jgi:predicted aspartyl protease
MGTFFAEALLAAPGAPEHGQRVVTIEGQVVERDAAEVLITLEGRTLRTLCLFGAAGELDVLGAYTLEGFGLAVDPVQRNLVPALQYGAAAA